MGHLHTVVIDISSIHTLNVFCHLGEHQEVYRSSTESVPSIVVSCVDGEHLEEGQHTLQSIMISSLPRNFVQTSCPSINTGLH